jgi:hypothetical protein
MTNDDLLELAAELINNDEDLWRFILSFLSVRYYAEDIDDAIRWEVLRKTYDDLRETAPAWQETLRLLRDDLS